MDYNKIGSFIAEARKERKLTQKELADFLHITDRAVSKWERGKGCPDISLMEDLSKVLDISIIEILKGEKINSKNKINNEDITYSLNYVEKNIKEKTINILNIASIVIITIIGVVLLLYNLKIYFYLNQNYYTNVFFANNEEKVIFYSTKNKLDIISNSQGKYSDNEYKTIMEIVNYIKSNSDIDSEYNLFAKKNYTYKDMRNFADKESNYNISSIFYISIQNILSKYYINYNIDTNNYYENLNKLKDFVYNYYKYNYLYDFEYNKSNHLREVLYYKYTIYDSFLQAIIDGGEINE